MPRTDTTGEYAYDKLTKKLAQWHRLRALMDERSRLHTESSQNDQALASLKTTLGNPFDADVDKMIVRLEKQEATARDRLPLAKLSLLSDEDPGWASLRQLQRGLPRGPGRFQVTPRNARGDWRNRP